MGQQKTVANLRAGIVAALPGGMVARNFFSLSAAALVERSVTLFGGIYARNVLQPEAIGKIGWTSAMVAYVSLLVGPGLIVIAKRDVARDPKQAAHYVSLLFMIQMILSVSALAVVWLGGGFVGGGREISLLLVLHTIGLLLLPFDLTWLLHAHERMARLAVAGVVLQVLQLGALFALIHGPEQIFLYVWFPYPFRLALNAFTVWYALHHGLFDWRGVRFKLDGARRLLRVSLPVVLSQVAILLYYNSDVIFLGFSHGNAVVGLYSTAYSMMLVPVFLILSLSNAAFPAVARSFHDTGQAQQTSEKFLRLAIWLGFPLAALGWAVGRHLIALLFGPGFSASGPLFEWLSLNLALIFFNVGYVMPLNAWQHESLAFRCTLAGALTNLGLNFWLIPKYGAKGAVVTTVLAEAVVLVAAVVARRGVHPLPWHKWFLRTAAVCCLAAFAARLAAETLMPWWCAAALGGGVCVAGFMLLEQDYTRAAIAAVWQRPRAVPTQ
ncbi:MAG: flippase [Acidobacteria bacterium]|nr:flippase [Acidobacteriota bacterium]